jgi:DNA-directed RNA polymerase specialized sigma24 family protein
MNKNMEILMPSANAVGESAEAMFNRRMQLVMESVSLHHRYLVTYLMSFAPHSNVEDVVQDLWKYVILNFPIEKIQDLGLLRRKAYQIFVDHYRKARTLNEMKAKVELEPLPEHGEAAFDDRSEAELKERFWLEYDIGLTDQQQEVVWQHARYGLTFEEIEMMLGVKASTAFDWVRLARKKLAAVLND